jgi:hypothetical protein
MSLHCRNSKLSGLWAGLVTLLLPAIALAGWRDQVDETLRMLKPIGIAVGILFAGWILARILSSATHALLKKTTLDNKIAKALGIHLIFPDVDKGDAVENAAAKIVYYLILLLAVIGALDYAGLAQAAGPLSGFVETIVQAVPSIGKAALILLVAYFAGLILRKLVTTALSKTKVVDKLAEATGAEDKAPFSETAGIVVFWLAMLIGLAGAFEALKIDAIADPMRNMIDTVIQLIPALAIGAVILLGGYILGRIARAVVSNLLASVGADELPARVKLDKLFEKRKLSDVLGLTLFIFVMLHAVIAAADQLGLQAISEPIGSTIQQFWTLLPSLTVAGLVVVVGVVIGRVVRALVIGLLGGVGFDGWLGRLGLDLGMLSKKSAEGEDAEGGSLASRLDSPSEILGTIAQLAVVLVAVVQALQTLGLGAWAEMVETFLSYTMLNVLVALAIVAVGFALGNYVRDLIGARDGDAAKAWMGSGARAAILVFAFTMAIQQLEVAPQFVLLTFGLLFGALCLALALAFGLGAREVAGDIVKTQYGKANGKKPLGLGRGPLSK